MNDMGILIVLVLVVIAAGLVWKLVRAAALMWELVRELKAVRESCEKIEKELQWFQKITLPSISSRR